MSRPRVDQKYLEYPEIGPALNLSRMNSPDEFIPSIESHLQRESSEMEELERGAIANPDEKRMVGHYWLARIGSEPGRTLAVTTEIRNGTLGAQVSPFAMGALIALFEPTIGLYDSSVNVNAYHQPRVGAGNRAASDINALQVRTHKSPKEDGRGGRSCENRQPNT